nr:Chain B, CYS-PRO-ALA-ARG-PHE-M70-ALA-LEU-TRP-CYS [synthetic construct]
CPARFAALWC